MIEQNQLSIILSNIKTREDKITKFSDDGDIIKLFKSCSDLNQLSLWFDQLCEAKDRIDIHEHNILDNTLAFWKRNTNSWQKLIENIREHALAVLIRQVTRELDDNAAIRILTEYKEKPLFSKHRSNNLFSLPFATHSVDEINRLINIRLKQSAPVREAIYIPVREAVAYSPNASNPKLTLQDLLTVLDIANDAYDFSATHLNIKRRYYNPEIPLSLKKIIFSYEKKPESPNQINIIENICRETKLQYQNIADNQIHISEMNCQRLKQLLAGYFHSTLSSRDKYFSALVQLDGLLTGFTYFFRNGDFSAKTSNVSPLAILNKLAQMNLLPLPAAEKYIIDHIDQVNHSDLLIAAVANSCAESALIILKHISPSSIFNKNQHCRNNALQLAIAKGRHHVDSGCRSSLNLGYVIDAIFTIIQNTRNFNIELFDEFRDAVPAIKLASLHGDEKSITKMLELGFFNSELKSASIQEKNYKDVTRLLKIYTNGHYEYPKENWESIIDAIITWDSQDSTHYHYDTFSILKENEWQQKTENCTKLVRQEHIKIMNSKFAPQNYLIISIDSKLTLQDLQTVIEISESTYDFSRTYPNITFRYHGKQRNVPQHPLLDTIATVLQKTKKQYKDGTPLNQILVSAENCSMLQTQLNEYFIDALDSNQTIFTAFAALTQLDGMLTNFANFTLCFCRKNTPIETLRYLGIFNLLPLPAAENYLVKHLADVNTSDILISIVANSRTESALILLKYISPSCIFNRNAHWKNTALELAIAKGRYHLDTANSSLLTLSFIIDRIFEIIKKSETFTHELQHYQCRNQLLLIELALAHADIETIAQLKELVSFELNIIRWTNYQESASIIRAYLDDEEDRQYREDHMQYNYYTYSFLKEHIWQQKIQECKDLLDTSHRKRVSISPC